MPSTYRPGTHCSDCGLLLLTPGGLCSRCSFKPERPADEPCGNFGCDKSAAEGSFYCSRECRAAFSAALAKPRAKDHPPDGPERPRQVVTQADAGPDPWKHRSEGMVCKTCMYFVLKAKEPGPPEIKDFGNLGRCRRHAPTMSGFPAVYERDWCGDHKLDEAKA